MYWNMRNYGILTYNNTRRELFWAHRNVVIHLQYVYNTVTKNKAVIKPFYWMSVTFWLTVCYFLMWFVSETLKLQNCICSIYWIKPSICKEKTQSTPFKKRSYVCPPLLWFVTRIACLLVSDHSLHMHNCEEHQFIYIYFFLWCNTLQVIVCSFTVYWVL